MKKNIGWLFILIVFALSWSGANAWGAGNMDNLGKAEARIDKAERSRQEGQANATDPVRDSDPEFAAIYDNLLYGEILPNGSLGKVRSALVIIAGLTASQGWEALPAQLAAALQAGASPVEIREVLYQCSPYVGLPNVEKALLLAKTVFLEKGISLPLEKGETVTEETRLKDGLALQRQIFGAEAIDKMRANAPEAQKELVANYLSAWCFGDFYTRKGLDLKMRELVTFSAIVALGGCDPQAKAHAQANLTVGNTPENLVDALSALLPWIGFPRTLNGLAAVNAVLPQ